MSKFDRKAAKKKLLKRTEEQNARKDQGQFGSYFKRSDLPMFQCETGKHKIDIIPYIAGKKDPNVPKGEPTYLLDIWVHRNIGPSNDQYVCLAKNYKQNCPICNYRKEYESDLDDDQLDNLKPKRRTVYNIVDRTTEDGKKKGVQIFEIAHWFMEKRILPQAENPDTGGVIAFSDPEEGSTIYFKKSGSGDTTAFEGHKLLERSYKISDKILDQAFTLDELIHVPSEEELENVAKGLRKSLKKSADAEDADDDEDEDEEETTTKRKKSSRSDDEDDVPDDVEEDDDDEEEEPKKKKKSKKSDDDEEEEEEEEPKKKKGKGKGKCPEGGTFGKDFDKFDGCVDCDNFDECSDANDSMSGDDDDEEEEEEQKSKKGGKKKVDDDDDDDEEPPKKKKRKDDDEDDDEEEEPKKKKSKFNRRTGR